MWSFGPCEGLVAHSARNTFTSQLFEDPEYWFSPWKWTHDLLLWIQELYWLSYSCCSLVSHKTVESDIKMIILLLTFLWCAMTPELISIISHSVWRCDFQKRDSPSFWRTGYCCYNSGEWHQSGWINKHVSQVYLQCQGISQDWFKCNWGVLHICHYLCQRASKRVSVSSASGLSCPSTTWGVSW